MVFPSPPGSAGRCPICFWEDDIAQLRFPAMAGGANQVSLLSAQKNFDKFGACQEEHQSKVRPAGGGDSRDANWRMINPYLDNIEEFIPWVGREANYPEGEMTTLYYWRETYWRKKSG
jgi:hypothetical protein